MVGQFRTAGPLHASDHEGAEWRVGAGSRHNGHLSRLGGRLRPFGRTMRHDRACSTIGASHCKNYGSQRIGGRVIVEGSKVAAVRDRETQFFLSSVDSGENLMLISALLSSLLPSLVRARP